MLDRLREDYRNGEPFHAADMNQLTHNVNELGDSTEELMDRTDKLEDIVAHMGGRIEYVDELPEEGEENIIYAVPNKERMYMEYMNPSLMLDEEKIVLDTNLSNVYSGYTTFKVGDIIMSEYVSGDDEPIILVNTINIDEFKMVIDYSGKMTLQGVTNYINYEPGHFYRITGVYDIPFEATIQLYQELITGYNGTLFTYEEVTSDMIHADYDFGDMVFPCCNLGMNTIKYYVAYLNDYNQFNRPATFVKIFDTGNTYYISCERDDHDHAEDYIHPEIGDTIKYTGDEYYDRDEQYIAATSIDENNLSYGDGFTFGGITEYIGLQTNHCYVVTGKYVSQNVSDWILRELEEHIDASEYGVRLDCTIFAYTYSEIPNTDETTYTLNELPCCYFNFKCESGDEYDEYYWKGGKYEKIGGGGVTEAYLEKNYYDIEDIQDKYYNKTTINSYQTEINTALNGKVSSTTVKTLWSGTQEQYDAIQNKDPQTLYIIKSA